MKFVYQLFIYCIGYAIKLSSLFYIKSKKWVEGRKNIWSSLDYTFENRKENKNSIWLHCASLGEFEQGRELIELIRKQYPQKKILLTFFSPSGFEVQQKYSHVDWVYYLPLDIRQNAKRLVGLIEPQIFILVKYEFWWNILSELNKKRVPILIIAAIFRKNQYFFKWYGLWFLSILKNIDHFFVQEYTSCNLLLKKGIKQISVVGDPRYDRVFTLSQKKIELDKIQKFKQDNVLIVAGSTWKIDHKHFVRYLKNMPQNVKLIIAPHEINQHDIEKLIDEISLQTIRYTSESEQNFEDAKVCILDTIGSLSKVYKYADISYIGGGFYKQGIHNCLEAAIFGSAVFFGPNYKKFNEAKELLESQGCISVNNYDEFEITLNQLIFEIDKRLKLGANAKSLVLSKVGASTKIFEYINKMILCKVEN